MNKTPYKVYACKFEHRERNPRFTEITILKEYPKFYTIPDSDKKIGKKRIEKYWLNNYYKDPKDALESQMTEFNNKIKQIEEWKEMIQKEFNEKYNKENK